jgi:hypothetical protein
MADLPPINMDATTALPPINTNLPTSSSSTSSFGAGPSKASRQYQDKAIAAIAKKKQRKFEIPTIDFTQHQLENGDIVNTNERVVKDVGFTESYRTLNPVAKRKDAWFVQRSKLRPCILLLMSSSTPRRTPPSLTLPSSRTTFTVKVD